MFRRDAHRRALAVLAALDGDLLERTATLFAGGTRLVLDFDQHRVSEDLDFLCADAAGYAEVRSLALSRDLIDLGMRRARAGEIPPEAWVKAEGAYRSAVRADLAEALRAFLDDEAHRQRCFNTLDIANPAEILAGIEALRADLMPVAES